MRAGWRRDTVADSLAHTCQRCRKVTQNCRKESVLLEFDTLMRRVYNHFADTRELFYKKMWLDCRVWLWSVMLSVGESHTVLVTGGAGFMWVFYCVTLNQFNLKMSQRKVKDLKLFWHFVKH